MTIDIKELSRKTAYNAQQQNIIICHSKLEPVKLQRYLCYTEWFIIHPASSQNYQPLYTSSIDVFISKISYLILTIDPKSLARSPTKMGYQIPFKMIHITYVLQLSFIKIKQL